MKEFTENYMVIGNNIRDCNYCRYEDRCEMDICNYEEFEEDEKYNIWEDNFNENRKYN